MSEHLVRRSVVIHQPQYLPYLGYFLKMSFGELFVYLDTVPFSRNKVQNRNVIRGPNGPITLTVPVKATHLTTPIADVQIDNTAPWMRKHWKSIEQSYRTYPHFHRFCDPLRDTYERRWDRLVDLNVHLTRQIAEWLGLSCPGVRSSQLPVDGRQNDLLIEICRELGATTYVSGEGAKAYLEPQQFADAGIAVSFVTFRHPLYRQPVEPFVPALSTIDLLMSEGPDAGAVLVAAQRVSDVTPWQPASV